MSSMGTPIGTPATTLSRVRSAPFACIAREKDIGRSAAHIESDDALKPSQRGHAARAHHAARGTRKHRAHRLARGQVSRHNSAGGLHYIHTTAFGRAATLRSKARQVRAHARRKIRVHHGRRCALVFTKLRQNTMRRRNRNTEL